MKVSRLLFFMVIPIMAFSQTRSSDLDLLKEDDIFHTRLSQFLPAKERYRYNEFKDGRVYSVPHKESNVTKLNYNLLLREMVMIGENHDTIFVANFEIIKYILIDKDLYYHDYKKGYYELLTTSNDSVRLAKQQWLEIQSRNMITDSRPLQLEAYKNIFRVVYHPLNQTLHSEVVKLSHEVAFYLIDQNEEIHRASKSGFLKVFPTHKKEIKDYLKKMARQQGRVSYTQQEDLKKLLAFCANLK